MDYLLEQELDLDWEFRLEKVMALELELLLKEE